MMIKDCMTKKVELATPGMSLRDVARKMRDGDFGALPVAEDDRLIGMITDRDIVTRAVANHQENPMETKVREVMSQNVYYCFEDQDLDEVAANMGDNQIRRLPVLNERKKLVGIVSLGDLALKKAKTLDQALLGISRHEHRDTSVHYHM